MLSFVALVIGVAWVPATAAAVEEVIADARDAAAAITTSNPTRFAETATALGRKLNKALAPIGDGFDGLPERYDTSSLEAAQPADPACSVLGG